MADLRCVAGFGPVLAILGWATISASARADRILLRGGGELRGKVVVDPSHPGKTMVQTEKGSAPIAFAPEAIAKVIPAPGPLDEYFERRDTVESTAAAEYGLGNWCESAGLTGLAEGHYRRAIEHDPAYALAHKKLGHVERGGRWLSSDEDRAAQGLVKSRGKWVTPEEKARHDAGAAFSSDQASWARRIKIYRQAIYSEKPEARESAERELLAIREPAAAAPLVRAFAKDEGPARRLVLQVLASIPGPEAQEVLVGRALFEPEAELRAEAVSALAGRDDAGAGVAHLLKALRHRDPAVAGHAATALSGLNAAAAVPKLVGVLVTLQREVVYVTPESSQPSGPSLISGGGPSVGVLTGIAAGPGAIGFGAMGVPVFSGVALGGGAATQKIPEPRLVQYLYNNEEVLQALVQLTGVNYGFDQAAWKRWIVSSFQAPEGPARRIPQP